MSDFVNVMPGFIAPREYRVTTTFHENDAPEITLEMRVNDDGKPACTRLQITPTAGHEVTAQMLRAIPIGLLVRNAASLGLRAGHINEDGSPTITSSVDIPADAEAAMENRARRPRGYGLDADELQEVARTYQRAIKIGRPPTEYVRSEHHFGSRSTASRWIRRARDAGYLGEAIPYRAGEKVSV